MAISSRNKTIAFFIVLGACSVAVALALNITWVIHWREVGMIVLGIIFFAFIIAGVTLNTVFLVREVRRSEQHDSFINAVTHELKTPIASIRLYLETLQSRNLDEAQRKKFYGVMLEDTERLLATVEQVLRAGQLGQKANRTLQPVNIVDIARESADLARTRHHLTEDNIRFVNHTYAPAMLEGDAEELRSAVGNLLDNAVKYSVSEIAVTVEVLDDANDLLVRVSDRGVGIPRHELKRIFRRFYRVPQRFKKGVKGTGLGLFIVRTIARRHGGDAYAASEGEGKGSTFTIRLPRSRS